MTTKPSSPAPVRLRVSGDTAVLAGCAAFFLVLASPAPLWAATQSRALFGQEQFTRTTGATNIFQRSFTVQQYVSSPYELHLVNGNPDGSSRVGENAVSSGRVLLDGVEVVSPNDFSVTVATIDKTLTLVAGPHALEVQLGSAPNSYIRLTISGVIALGDLSQSRAGHASSVLPDGAVLLTGGTTVSGVSSAAERFSPVSLQSTALTSALTTARTEHAQSPLAQRDALLIGGQDALGNLFSVERFRLSDQTFQALSPTLQVLRSRHTSNGLIDGRVLITGGQSSGALGSAEAFDAQTAILFKPAYDPESSTFSVLPNGLNIPRWDHAAVTLNDGRILITGGRSDTGFLASAEIFDPGTEEFTALSASLSTPRSGHTMNLLPDGRVIILGGENASGVLATAEVWTPATGTFTALTQSLLTPRANHTSTLLPFGEIVVTGGRSTGGTILASTEFYGPPAGDTLAPIVQEVSPPNSAPGVDRTQIIGVRFSEPVDVRTLTTTSVTLSSGGGPVAATISPGESGLMVFLVPAAPLSPGTTYTLSLTTAIKDTSGHPLSAFTSSFTIVPAPTITSFDPASGTAGTTVTITGTNFDPVASKNEVTFNGALATVTAASTTSLTATVPSGATTGPITVTTRGGTATSATHFTVITVPTITGFIPTSGSVGTLVTLTGTNFVSVQSVRFNTVPAQTFSVQSPTALTATVPLGATTGRLSVLTPAGTGVSAVDFVVTNAAPTLAPIGHRTIALGTTLSFTVAATDPEGDAVTFAVTPLPLPAHAVFNATTGEFTFTPDATQVGTVTVTFVASDGAHTSSETITLTVPGAPAGGVTALTGRVDDTARQPIANVTVALKGTSLSTITDAQGLFTLTGIPATQVGRQQVVVTGFAQGYANLVAPVDLIAHVTTQLPHPLTLPPVDMATAVTVNANATTLVQSATLNVSVTIPPHTAKNADGTEYTGVLTISPVPEYGRVESRPAELRPGLSITIQPAGILLDPPAPITLPNVDQMAPGNELDLWSLSPDTGTFHAVGRLRVSADGQRLETLSGGVRQTAWHFALAPSATPAGPTGFLSGQCTTCQVASAADLAEGALQQDVRLPGVRTLGVARDLTLHYRSTSAEVRPILPVDAALSFQAAVPQTFSARLTLGGLQQGTELYWNASGLPESFDSVSRLGVQIDAASLATGRYPAELMLFSNYPQSSIGGGITEQPVVVRNERGSHLGAGWTLAELDRLVPLADGSVLLAQGSGETLVFGARLEDRPLVVDSFDLTRSAGSTAAGQYSFVSGSIHAGPRSDLLDPANFGPGGVVSRPVQLRSGLSVLTPEALAGVDVFVLNSWATPPTASEVVALEQFVQEGGTLLELQANFPQTLRPVLLGTFGGSLTFDTNAFLTGQGLTSPLIQGPFGTVPDPIATATQSDYPVLGPFIPIARNDSGHANIVALQPGPGFGGRGRAAFFADAEIFASGFVSGGTNLYATNRRLFLNTMAFLARAPGFHPTAPGGTVTFLSPPGEFSTVVKQADGTYTRTRKDGTRSQFTAQGLQTAITDRNGNTTTYAYEAQGRLTTITDPAGQVTTFSYSGTVLATITDPAGRGTHFTHDADGNLTRVTYADASQETFAYDPQHRLTTRTDARNQVSQYQYDYAGRLSQATLPTGVTRTLTPTQRAAVPNVAAGQGTPANPAPLASPNPPATFTDGRGNVTTFELDSLSRVTKQTDALTRVTTITRDAQGNPTTITRPNGAVTTLTYDAKGNLLTSTESAIAATTTFTYEPAFNQVTSLRDPKNSLTQIAYDAKGNPLTITDANNQVTTFTYDPRGLLTSTTDALNQITTFTYDTQGRLVTTTDPSNRTSTLTYDAAGNVATSTDALNRVTSFEYDAFNRLKTVTDPATGVTQYTYDGNGNLATVKDAKNHTTTFVYDAVNRLASTTDPLGKTETYTYDGADNLLTRVTPKAETISFAYDAVNQLLSKTLPGNLITSYTYDAVGSLTGVTDPDSVLAMTYDLANRLTSVATTGSPTQPSVTLGSTYDQNGSRLTLGDPTGSHTYGYDALNRLTTQTLPPFPAAPGTCPAAPQAVGWWPGEGTAVDLVGLHPGLLQNGTTFIAGQIGQGFLFDGVDDLVHIPAAPDLDLTTAVTIEAWVYPTASGGPIRVLAGRPAGFQLALMPGGFVRFAIPQGGIVSPQVDTTSLLPLDTWTHVVGTYDAATGELRAYFNGVLEQTVVGTGPMDSQPTTPFQIGGFQAPIFTGAFFTGRIDEVHLYARALTAAEVQARTCVGPPAPPAPAVQYAYDALSRRTSVTLPNSTQTTYSYDPASQVTNILHKIVSGGAQINKADYVYNNVGNRTSLTDRRGAQTFGYDNLDRLTSATHPLTLDQSFSYDAVGNRLNNASQHNMGNQLTEDAGFTYQYDHNGNLTRKTVKASGVHTDYTYDAENRLVKVEEFAAGATVPAATSSYRYDGLGRRIEKVGNGITRRYIYDGEDILLEYDETNTLLARYTHGPGIDEPIAMTRGGSTFFYHQDGLGTVTELTDNAGATAKAYAYDAWGNIIQQTGTLENPFTYTGREFDVESGLYYYRARYYDPTTGRLLQTDPIGIIGTDTNLYMYARNRPVNLLDPLGLAPPDVVPLGVDICQNIREARYLPGEDWVESVAPDGRWDYKRKNPKFENFGNYNYGLTGRANGWSADSLRRAAGIVQITQGNSKKEFGWPWGDPPYGDDPKDQEWINQGIEDFNNGYWHDKCNCFTEEK